METARYPIRAVSLWCLRGTVLSLPVLWFIGASVDPLLAPTTLLLGLAPAAAWPYLASACRRVERSWLSVGVASLLVAAVVAPGATAAAMGVRYALLSPPSRPGLAGGAAAAGELLFELASLLALLPLVLVAGRALSETLRPGVFAGENPPRIPLPARLLAWLVLAGLSVSALVFWGFLAVVVAVEAS